MNQNQPNFQDLTNAFTICNKQDKESRDQGEAQLKQMGQAQQYPSLLFQYIQNNQNTPEFILRASIELKLWCEKYKKIDDYNHQYLQETVQQIKSQIVSLYVGSGTQISNQLEQAILNLASRDFFKNYPNLLQDIFSNIQDPQFSSKNSLQTAYKVLKILQRMIDRYEYSMRSDPLYEEIIYVCDYSHDILFTITNNIMNSLTVMDNVVEKLKVLKIIMRLFYYLNFQDLHPKFEDNLNNWMTLMQSVLKLQIDSSVLGGNDFILFKCKGECLKCILLYVTKYREEFQYLIQNFSQDIWAMCNITNSDSKFDKIVLNALKYFKTLCLYQEMRSSIQGNIPTLMTSLLIPNLGISKSDVTMFTQEPETYIQTFFDSYDSNSRKGVTVDLLKCLAKNYKDNLITFIQSVIPQYKQQLDNGQQDQVQEIVLINLVIDSSTAGFRPVDGVSDLNLSADLITYFYDNIIKVNLGKLYQQMISNTSSLVEDHLQPILVSFYLRFFFYFRNHINRAEILQLASICSFLYRTKSPALKQIVCHTVQALLSLKENVKDLYTSKPVFNKDNIDPQIQQILQNLYILAKESELDVFIIKCVNQIINLMKENSSIYIAAFGDLFKDQLTKIGRGYDFQKAFLIFEGIGMVVQYTSDNNKLEEFELAIQNEMNQFISKGMSDLISYVIQIYAIFVKTPGSQIHLKEVYQNLFQSMLVANNWSENNTTLFQSYIVFMDSYLQKQPQFLTSSMPQLQIIIQKLFSLQIDKLIFQFTDVLIKNMDITQLRSTGLLSFILQNSIIYYQQQQNQQNKQKKGIHEYNKQFVLFFSRLVIKHSGLEIIKDFDGVTQGLLQNILVQEIALIKTIQIRQERKTLFVAMTDILFSCISFFNMDMWGTLMNAMLENCSNKMRIYSLSSYSETIGGTINQGDSGFQRLTVLNSDDTQNEDKYFGQKFNEFYSNPQIQNALNFATILTENNQKTLSKLIQQN